MKSIYLVSYLTLFLSINPTYADTSLRQIQSYLNGSKTLRGNFTLQSPNGSASGHFAIRKPGQIRFDDPSQVIFSNNGVLYIYNKSSGDVSQMDLNQSLAEFLLRSNINFEEEGINVKKFAEYDDTIELALQKAGSEDIGEITLVFQRKPLQLIQWTIIDAQNQSTTVDIDNVRRNESFELVTDPNMIMTP